MLCVASRRVRVEIGLLLGLGLELGFSCNCIILPETAPLQEETSPTLSRNTVSSTYSQLGICVHLQHDILATLRQGKQSHHTTMKHVPKEACAAMGFAAVILCVRLYRKRQLRKAVSYLQGGDEGKSDDESVNSTMYASLGWPLIGESAAFVAGLGVFSRSRFAATDDSIPVYLTSIFGRYCVIVRGSSLVPKVLRSEPRHVVPKFNPVVGMLVGEHSILNQQAGKYHSLLRQVAIRAVGNDAVPQLLTFLHGMIQEKVALWKREQHSHDALKENRLLLLQLMCNTMFGPEAFQRMGGPRLSQLFQTWLGAFLSLPINLPFTTFGKGMAAKKELERVLLREIAEGRKQLELAGMDQSDAASPVSVIESLLTFRHPETDALLEEQVIIDMLMTLLFAAHDTTSIAMTSFIQMAIEHPEILTKVRDELAEAFGSERDVSSLTHKEMRSLVYLEAVVLECLRIRPPVPDFARCVNSDFSPDGQHFLRKGWTVGPSILGTFDAEFDDPQETRPERFINPNTNQLLKAEAKKVLIAFGSGGPHQCLGRFLAKAELRMFILHIAAQVNRITTTSTLHTQWTYLPLAAPPTPLLFTVE